MLKRKQSNVEQGVHKITFLIQPKNGLDGHISVILSDKKKKCDTSSFCSSNAFKKVISQSFGKVSLTTVMSKSFAYEVFVGNPGLKEHF